MSKSQFVELTGCSAAVADDLETYRTLLIEWNGTMNLVGPATLAAFWSRHALDSYQLLALAPQARVWADLGAGAGLPGIVLAIGLKDHLDCHVHLIESMAKRCRFLSEVCSVLDLKTSIHNHRAEDIRLNPDIVTARACAPVVRLLDFAEPCLKSGALGLFLKGENVEAEIAEAARTWKLDYQLHPSQSDARGRIMEVRKAKRVG